jgi:hypothetical protein
MSDAPDPPSPSPPAPAEPPKQMPGPQGTRAVVTEAAPQHPVARFALNLAKALFAIFLGFVALSVAGTILAVGIIAVTCSK